MVKGENMKLTMAERLARCRKNFWMWNQDSVVVQCVDCHRSFPIPYRYVCDAGGRVSRAKCESCGTDTCVPVLKDHETLACTEGVETVILIDHKTGQRLIADTIMKELAKTAGNKFEEEYCRRSELTKEEYDKDYITLPCHCGAEGCEGWACVCKGRLTIKAHAALYMTAQERSVMKERLELASLFTPSLFHNSG